MKRIVVSTMLLVLLITICSCGEVENQGVTEDKAFFDDMFSEEVTEKGSFEGCTFTVPEGFKEKKSEDPVPEGEGDSTPSTAWIYNSDTGFGFTLTIEDLSDDLEDEIKELKDEADKAAEGVSVNGKSFTLLWQEWPYEQITAIYENDGKAYFIATDEPETDELIDEEQQVFLRFVKSIDFGR